ncbi:MAG: hypothetical protein ACK5QX_12550, partial [bacterium]
MRRNPMRRTRRLLRPRRPDLVDQRLSHVRILRPGRAAQPQLDLRPLDHAHVLGLMPRLHKTAGPEDRLHAVVADRHAAGLEALDCQRHRLQQPGRDIAAGRADALQH